MTLHRTLSRHMQRISVPYAYNLGKTVQLVLRVSPNTKLGDVRFYLLGAAQVIDGLLNESVYSPFLVACRASGENALAELRKVGNDPDDARILDFLSVWNVQNAVQTFETIFSAEMDQSAVFLVTPKRGYNVRDLVWFGENLFPIE